MKVYSPVIVSSSKVNLGVFRGDLPKGTTRRNFITMFDQEGSMIARLDASISIRFAKNTSLIRDEVL